MDTDVNYKSYVNENNLTIESWENPEFPSLFDDVMKFSNCSNVFVRNVTVNGGKEDCIDAVRGSNYSFENLTLNPFCNGVTLKGSIDGWSLKDILFTRAGTEYTVEVGQYDNYWKVGRAATRNGTLNNVKVQDGSKVILRLWDAEMPQIINCPNVKLVKVPKIIWFPYFCFQGTLRFFTNLFKKKQ